MRFEDVLPALREGKSVRRPAWDDEHSTPYRVCVGRRPDENFDKLLRVSIGVQWAMQWVMQLEDMNATDWEICE